jgi:hypothetical protein
MSKGSLVPSTGNLSDAAILDPYDFDAKRVRPIARLDYCS